MQNIIYIYLSPIYFIINYEAELYRMDTINLKCLL